MGSGLVGVTKPLFLLGIAILAAGLTLAAPVDAATRHRNRAAAPRAVHKVAPLPGSPTDPDKDAALILDGATGKVLYARAEGG